MDFASELVRRGLMLIGTFKLTSGKESPYYIDLRRLPSHVDLFGEVVNRALEILRGVDYDYVVGVATGGVPLASFIACRTGKPMGYVRQEKKGHGTSRLVEGEAKGRKVLLVDDVATTGGSLRNSVEALRAEGAEVVAALVVVDRQEGAKGLIEGMGVKFLSVYRVSELLGSLLNSNLIGEGDKENIRKYLQENAVGLS
ncbi:MAG: orotate phosphoribosyltransferase [Thermoprotei archaeon]